MNKTIPRRSHAGFIIVVGLSIVCWILGKTLNPASLALLSYGEWFQKVAERNLLQQLAWLVSDWGDAAFQKTALGGFLMVFGGFIAYFIGKKRTFWKEGMPLTGTMSVSYRTGLFPRVVAAQIIAAFISNFLYARMFNLPDIGFVPTFVPIVSIAPSVVLVYGGEPRKVITAGVLAGIICTPFAHVLNMAFVFPHALSGVIGFVGSMTIGGAMIFEVCKYLPWMQKNDPPASKDDPPPPKLTKEISSTSFFIRKVLSDFTDANFYGNEIAGGLFIIGGIVIFFINPANPAYGTNYLLILSSQFLTAAIGVYLWWHRIHELVFYPTYVPVVTVAPVMLLTYGFHIHVLIAGSLLGAVIGPPMGSLIGRNVPEGWHPYLGFTASMLITTLIVQATLLFVPGFGIPW